MTSFVYILTEGVHDVAFLGKLLTVCFQGSRLRTLEELEEAHRKWFSLFKWPLTNKSNKTPIERLSVPAPVFYRVGTDAVVALRNAQGLTEIGKTLFVDFESFSRDNVVPASVGVVLDSDDAPAEQRFQELARALQGVKLKLPASLGEVSVGPPRVGVFALPEPGMAGTLEDVLLSLAAAAYPELCASARSYAEEWRRKADGEPSGSDWREIKKPAGTKKAAVGAMTAMLKPGKSAQVSLEDNRWVSEATKTLPGLQPCLAFMGALLAGAPVAAPEGLP